MRKLPSTLSQRYVTRVPKFLCVTEQAMAIVAVKLAGVPVGGNPTGGNAQVPP